MNDYGRALRRWRRLRGVKQSHAAELLGVTQATLSRWERSRHRLSGEAERKLSQLLRAPLDSAGDAGLRRLVEGSALPVHLICDLSHRLLAASPARVIDWTADIAELRGRSLWRYATDEIRAAEGRLGQLGWYDDGVAQVSFQNGANDSTIVPIVPGILVWERLQLSDGTLARLVTSLP
jgi:transcriptional regulator with XRE-family HTH domain